MELLPDLARTLYCGDNLQILRTYLATESVDLIYLDPPFYSQRVYRASFKKVPGGPHGKGHAPVFIDVWRWNPTVEQAYIDLLESAPEPLLRTMTALGEILNKGSFFAYLVMMAARLVELYRVLKPTGSVYLHCDPAASHYLKILMDAVFGAEYFHNEIVWSYKTGGASRRHFARKHDLIFFYSKSDNYVFHTLKEKSYMMHRYGFKKSVFLRDERGEYTWVYMRDVWEMPALGAADSQRLGYPTQKPEALLERIIQASSNEGALVLDPFCGSGTTLATAQRLGRNWLGIESHYLGVAYQRCRLADAFPDLRYTLVGGPTTVEEARALAHADLAQFHWWVLALVCARPIGEESQGRRTRGSRPAHGQLPANAGSRAHFLVFVVIEKIEKSTQMHLSMLLGNGEIPGLLVITLDKPAREIEAGFAQLTVATGLSTAKVEIMTIAELLLTAG